MFVKNLIFMTEKELRALAKELNDTKGLKRELLETKLIKKTLSRMKWEKFWNFLFLIVGAVVSIVANNLKSNSLERDIELLNSQQVELNELYDNFPRHHHPIDTLSPGWEKSRSSQ